VSSGNEPPEGMEMLFHGAQGERGEKGETGETGKKGETGETGKRGPRGIRGLLSRDQARAVIFLFTLNAIFIGTCFFGLVHYVRSENAEHCTTVRQVSTIPLKSGPGRPWEARFEMIERKRLLQLGCGS
jgi:Collagen triple helix repeat (20 copies)